MGGGSHYVKKNNKVTKEFKSNASRVIFPGERQCGISKHNMHSSPPEGKDPGF